MKRKEGIIVSGLGKVEGMGGGGGVIWIWGGSG